MASQAVVATPSTTTSPCVGTSIRLISRRRVVFPEPLRPRRTRVSPEEMRSDTSETIGRAFTPYETPRNSMDVASSGMAVQSFAFISIDFHIFEGQTFRGPNLPPHFGRILRSGFTSNRKGKTPWEPL